MSRINLQTGDALRLFETLESDSIDLLIADPPYNLGKSYGNNNDTLNFNEYLKFSKGWLTEAARVLKPTGTLYVFMGVRFISYLFDILDRELGLHFNSWIVWHYTQGIGKRKGFSPRHDDILMFTQSADFTFNLDAVRVPQKYYRARNNMRGANPGDVWEFSHVHYSHPNRTLHPTQKPEGLVERLVSASSQPGDTVLDPFFGSGTTVRVCQQLQRNIIGFEINPDFVSLTQQRLEAPFNGFDSVDPRMVRVPNDLNHPKLRDDYLNQHRQWFLGRNAAGLERFKADVKVKYGIELDDVELDD